MADDVPVGQGELDSFKQKLDAWAETLDGGEQALLATLISRASGSEVESFEMSGGFGAMAAGFLSPLVASGGIPSAGGGQFPPTTVKGIRPVKGN